MVRAGLLCIAPVRMQAADLQVPAAFAAKATFASVAAAGAAAEATQEAAATLSSCPGGWSTTISGSTYGSRSALYSPFSYDSL
mmetsp:Transcript_21209/g.37911  ORF Transcript_21209/g.37911 Transcript_21209/m.37911 type:complete len:83 (-) Transcript_21209:769-1017(-)